MITDAEVVVVGAGMAGLAAADRLAADGRSVLVVEARDRVGGRVVNQALNEEPGPTGPEQVIELGGSFLGPTQHRAHALVRRLGLTLHPTYADGENLLERRSGRLVRYRGDIPAINPLVLADAGQAQVRLDRLARRVRLDAPWATPGADRYDAMTLATWLSRNVHLAEVRDMVKAAGRTVWACEPEDLSLLHVLFYIHSGGSFDELVGTRGGAQQDRVVGGTQLMATGLAGGLGDRLLLDHPVRRIGWDGAGVTVGLDSGGGGGIRDLRARRVIVALSPALAGRIDYAPALPAARDQLTQRTPMGSVIKCFAVYDEPFWRRDGLTGQAVSVIGPVSVTFDSSPPGGSPGVLVGFVGGRDARQFGQVSPAERRNAVVGAFARLLGPRAARPLRYLDMNWDAEPFSRGGPVGLMPPGAWTTFGRALRTPVGRIHWAGTETARVWSGFIDGAIRSGEDSAAAVLRAETSAPAVSR